MVTRPSHFVSHPTPQNSPGLPFWATPPSQFGAPEANLAAPQANLATHQSKFGNPWASLYIFAVLATPNGQMILNSFRGILPGRPGLTTHENDDSRAPGWTRGVRLRSRDPPALPHPSRKTPRKDFRQGSSIARPWVSQQQIRASQRQTLASQRRIHGVSTTDPWRPTYGPLASQRRILSISTTDPWRLSDGSLASPPRTLGVS
eukprot:366045-Chlamydomonas_euryale.AAC.2